MGATKTSELSRFADLWSVLPQIFQWLICLTTSCGSLSDYRHGTGRFPSEFRVSYSNPHPVCISSQMTVGSPKRTLRISKEELRA